MAGNFLDKTGRLHQTRKPDDYPDQKADENRAKRDSRDPDENLGEHPDGKRKYILSTLMKVTLTLIHGEAFKCRREIQQDLC
ncbi:hypothetical protein BOX15_Mlig008389g1 [Macrostomum lignano]|uniref:Uncharacterized protein n=1 Tax=Macrostomum lignano TaxID=282301 RepID=A0A267H0K5_9PLAT|nr:hypothetical protein BOX15_Mlig008389g1 [Macrostomum lignano]